MLALKITNVKKFTSLLFAEDTFDRFLLHDACFVTSYTTNIQGAKNRDFFEEADRDREMSVPFVSWEKIRPYGLKLLSGKTLPLGFKIVLLTSPESTAACIEKSGFTGCGVTSLSLNISYQNQELFLTSGISYNGFSPDRSLEKYWEESLLRFLNSKNCEYETPDGRTS